MFTYQSFQSLDFGLLHLHEHLKPLWDQQSSGISSINFPTMNINLEAFDTDSLLGTR